LKYPTSALIFCAAAIASSPALRDPAGTFWKQSAPPVFRVSLHTTQGDFVIECHREWAPAGADRFYNLVRAGYYDESRFYRTVPNYIVQFGIAGDPAISQIWRKQTIPDDPVRESNVRGFIGYAMTGPDTRSTQVYINLRDNSRLDSQGFAPFGKVVNGMDVVDKLYSGYGENSGGGMRAGKQDKMFEEGNAYLDHEFPKLDKLLKAALSANP